MGKILVLACLWNYFAVAQDAVQIAGRWRSLQTSKGGIGAMYDFGTNRTVQFSPGAIVPTRYSVEGDRLRLDSADGSAYTLVWDGDNHLRMTMNGAGEDYTRLGELQDANNKLLGEWIGTRDMDGKRVVTHWVFGADSKAVLMIRFFTETGTYTIQNGRLVAKFGEQVGLDGTISVADGVLTINRSGGRVTRLVRY